MSHETLGRQPFRLIAAMFLHADLFHIIGNMLFLGVFGPAAEGRLRTARFLGLYFLAGIVGGLFDILVTGAPAPGRWNIGASAAIMGVVGMYLFMFPHSKILVLFLAGFRARTVEWKAYWLASFYIFFDLWYGFTQAKDGVGHLAHLGGIAIGWAATMFLNTRFDTAEEAKALDLIKAAEGNLQTMPFTELVMVYEAFPQNADVAMAYVLRCARDNARKKAVQAMADRESILAEQGDPSELAFIILSLDIYDGPAPPWLTLRIATRLMRTEPGLAEGLLGKLLQMRPAIGGEILELTLLRLATLLEAKETSKEQAAALYVAVVERFPISHSASLARERLLVLGMPVHYVYSAEEGKVVKATQPRHRTLA